MYANVRARNAKPTPRCSQTSFPTKFSIFNWEMWSKVQSKSLEMESGQHDPDTATFLSKPPWKRNCVCSSGDWGNGAPPP